MVQCPEVRELHPIGALAVAFWPVSVSHWLAFKLSASRARQHDARVLTLTSGEEGRARCEMFWETQASNMEESMADQDQL
jgi:hypothetical protein